MRALGTAGLALALAVAASGCVGPDDNPTSVHDLRVLGVSLERPELMAGSCDTTRITPEQIAVFASPVQYTALIADPAGEGRSVHYQLFICAAQEDRACEEEDDRVMLAEGDLTPTDGKRWMELKLNQRPGFALAPDGTPMVQRVFERDRYAGLGGLRMPMVLHLTAGEEEIWAQKLMVFSCKFFEDSTQNVSPQLPGMTFGDQEWSATDVPTVGGAETFRVAPTDYADREEDYVVPALDLSAVRLHESWRISWYTDVGTFSRGSTGGVDVGGEESQPLNDWRPGRNAEAQDATFWFVVRDGRGGETWLTRTVHYRP